MPESLVRLERLIAGLDARQVPRKERARYLLKEVGGASLAYWSNLVNGGKSFGHEKARQIERGLHLAAGTLEADGLAPDAASIAGRFNDLPADTAERLELRKQLYTSIMAMIEAHAPRDPSNPAPAPGRRPSGGPARDQ